MALHRKEGRLCIGAITGPAPERKQCLIARLPSEEMPLSEEGRTRQAIDRIRSFLSSRSCGPGYTLIHRTSEDACKSILSTGLLTDIADHGCIDLCVTVHDDISDAARDDGDFRRLLSLRHRSSTRHLIIHVPCHALSDLAQMMEKGGVGGGATLDGLAYALGGTIPREWIAGVFMPEDGGFIQNADFDPKKRADFPCLDLLLGRIREKNHP